MPLSSTTTKAIHQLAQRISETQVKWRRHLHQNPELAYHETKTTAYLKREVTGLGLKIIPTNLKTGLIAEFKTNKPGPTVAVRTDIDALPIQEQSGVAFASRTPDCMHACGHDLHMATVLGAAGILTGLKDVLSGGVRFLFQPAEEMPPGGALLMIENGALKDTTMVFGLHVDPHLATGRIGLRDGPTMASVTDFDLIIHGKAGHGARPQDAIDAIATASEVIESLQKVVSRETDPVVPVAITFGRINGGVARNVIADTVTLQGTARTLSPKVARQLPSQIKKTAAAICKARGARLEMNIVGDYPVLVNSVKANTVLSRSFTALYPKTTISATDQVLGGEDFARYLQKVPGAMFRLGIRNRKIGADKPWHSPEFVADERAMTFGSSLIAAAVAEVLETVK